MGDNEKERPVVWIQSSAEPMMCDVCRADLVPLGKFYDAKTIYGPWGKLCEHCFEAVGVGLGTGQGQEYEKQGEQFVKIRG